ncbi:MAG: NAD kinase [Bacteroidia bacterium]
MQIAVFGKYFKDARFAEIQEFFNYLELKKINFSVYKNYYDDCLRHGLSIDVKTKTYSTYEEFINFNPDYVISIGGDGTILNSIEFIRHHQIPVAGINTGRLGFLAGVAAEKAKELVDDIIKGHYTIDGRTVLKLECKESLFGGVHYALNDFVLHKKDSSSMITIHTYLNGEFLNSYWSDGLIVATPTGSTGYNLSCGGPILYPTSASFVITPIAPHNLNVRPIILSDSNVISFEIEGRGESFLATLDSRSESIKAKLPLAIRKADFTFNLMRFNNENYLNTLRHKLMWGIDNRNFKN